MEEKNTYSKEIHVTSCQHCGTKLKLDSDDILAKQFICPRCKKINYVPEQITEQKIFVPIIGNKNPNTIRNIIALLFAVLFIYLCVYGLIKTFIIDNVFDNKEKRMNNMAYFLSDDILAKYFLYDNDSWYTKFSQVGKKRMNPFIENDIIYYQFKEITYKLYKDELNDADILNGYEWRGKVWSYAKLYRTATTNNKSIKFQWGEWKQSDYPLCKFEFEKYKGDWKNKKTVWTDEFMGYNLNEYYSKPSKEEIPK